jgi:hypothetical protein
VTVDSSLPDWGTDPKALFLSYCGILLLVQGLAVFTVVESLAVTQSGVAGILLATTGGVFVYDGVRRLRDDDPAEPNQYGLEAYAVLGFAVFLTGVFVLFLWTFPL